MALVNDAIPVSEPEAKDTKREANAKLREKNKQRREAIINLCFEIRDLAQQKGFWNQLKETSRDTISEICNPVLGKGGGGPSFFTVVFGADAKVGTKVTLKDVIMKTYKGMDVMSRYIKKWADKGIEVEAAVNKQDMLATTYTIKKLSQ